MQGKRQEFTVLRLEFFTKIFPCFQKYYFDVVHNKLEGALDRFAQFFIGPLFTDSATDREINAVNSEHEKNLATDVWRIRQVNKALADPAHPYSKFGTGNAKTLSDDPKRLGINVREELLKFHEQWYSANIMCLAVYGRETLDELEAMVIPRFSEIVNKNVVSTRWSDHPFLPEHYATKVSIVPVKDSRTLTLTFPTGDLDQFYKAGVSHSFLIWNILLQVKRIIFWFGLVLIWFWFGFGFDFDLKPEAYLSHLIGHEGKGSILSELKSRGWCNSLLAGHNTLARGFGFFDIMVDLTQEGFENIDEIIKIIFQVSRPVSTKFAYFLCIKTYKYWNGLLSFCLVYQYAAHRRPEKVDLRRVFKLEWNAISIQRQRNSTAAGVKCCAFDAVVSNGRGSNRSIFDQRLATRPHPKSDEWFGTGKMPNRSGRSKGWAHLRWSWVLVWHKVQIRKNFGRYNQGEWQTAIKIENRK